jgi:hypothetical protein
MSKQRDPEEVKKRRQAMLLEDVSKGTLSWWYISVANDDEFKGGFFLQARGPTEAWCLLHNLGWFPYNEGCDTQTYGPIPEDLIDEEAPAEFRWRKLTKEEVTNLGK